MKHLLFLLPTLFCLPLTAQTVHVCKSVTSTWDCIQADSVSLADGKKESIIYVETPQKFTSSKIMIKIFMIMPGKVEELLETYHVNVGKVATTAQQKHLFKKPGRYAVRVYIAGAKEICHAAVVVHKPSK